MDSNIIVALFSLAGTLIGTFGGIITANKLTNFRIEQLEKKVEKHNTIVERTYILERDLKTAFNYIEELKSRQDKEEDKIENVESKIESRINDLYKHEQ